MELCDLVRGRYVYLINALFIKGSFRISNFLGKEIRF